MGKNLGFTEIVVEALADLRPVVAGQRVLHLEPVARRYNVTLQRLQGALQGLRQRFGVETTTLASGKIYRVDSFGRLFDGGTPETALSATETPVPEFAGGPVRGAVMEVVGKPTKSGRVVLQDEAGDLWLAKPMGDVQ